MAQRKFCDHCRREITRAIDDGAQIEQVAKDLVGNFHVRVVLRFFTRRDLTDAWEQGKAAAEAAPK